MSYRPPNNMPTPPPGLPNLPSLNSTEALQREYHVMRESEERRRDFVEHLMTQVERLLQEKEDALRKKERVEFTCDAYQDRFKNAEKQLDSLRKTIDCDRFVLTLIDGDDTLFNDSYIVDGIEGGERASSHLQAGIHDYLKTRPDFHHDYKVQVRVYLNLAGLAGTYTGAGIISTTQTFYKFVQGFNKTHELMEIIDAGNGKEAADTKIKAAFTLFRRNLQCKHILLAASGDNSYGGFLRQFVPNTDGTAHLTLIQGREFAREIKRLADKLDTTSFPEIFRKTIIPTRSSPIPQQATTAAASTWSTPAVKGPVYNASAPLTNATNGLVSLSIGSAAKIWVNNQGQRLDMNIKELDRELANNLKRKKLCNRHHLRGDCDGNFCGHSHEGHLSDREKRHLRYVARSRPCIAGTACVDPDCFDGHRCAYGEKCSNENCRFPDEMHSGGFEGAREIVPPKYINV